VVCGARTLRRISRRHLLVNLHGSRLRGAELGRPEGQTRWTLRTLSAWDLGAGGIVSRRSVGRPEPVVMIGRGVSHTGGADRMGPTVRGLAVR
jgi:hypothetical protein